MEITVTRIVPWIVAALLLATAIALIFVFRRYDPNNPKSIADSSREITESVAEKFQAPANENVHGKNGFYIPYIQQFFAKSNSSDAHSIMFYPSIVDVACTTMESNLRSDLNCSNAYVDTVSTQDREAMLSMDPKHSCNSMAMSREPMDPKDSTLRILEARYEFVKTCIRVHSSGFVDFSDDSSVSYDYQLIVPSKAKSTAFIMSNRPVLLCANGTKLYKIDLPDEYDGDADNDVTIKLTVVGESKMWPSSKTGFDAALNDIYDFSDSEQTMNCTLYYLRTLGPVRIGVNDVNFDHVSVLSLCFDMSVASDPLLPEMSVGGKTFKVEIGGDNTNDVVVTVDGGDTVTLSDVNTNDGYVIVVWSTDLLMIYYLGRKAMKYASDKVPKLKIDGADVSRVRNEVKTNRASFPVSCHPNDTFRIPNFYDLNRKLVEFS